MIIPDSSLPGGPGPRTEHDETWCLDWYCRCAVVVCFNARKPLLANIWCDGWMFESNVQLTTIWMMASLRPQTSAAYMEMVPLSKRRLKTFVWRSRPVWLTTWVESTPKPATLNSKSVNSLASKDTGMKMVFTSFRNIGQQCTVVDGTLKSAERIALG